MWRAPEMEELDVTLTAGGARFQREEYGRYDCGGATPPSEQTTDTTGTDLTDEGYSAS